MISRFEEIMEELKALHLKKQADYGTDEDPLANIRESAKEWGVRPWVAALMRAGDKDRRLRRYAERGTLANEGVADSFKDRAIYTILAMILWEDEEDPGRPLFMHSQYCKCESAPATYCGTCATLGCVA